jgi:sialic acid synthase SpsE
MKTISLTGGRKIGDGQPCFIIAEAGVNHNGNLDMALKLVEIAADAGADAVKYQTFKAEHIITRSAPKAQYHIETTGGDTTQSWYDLLKSQELTSDMHRALIKRCNEKGIIFMSTPYDMESVDLLDELGVQLYKVASTDLDNVALLAHMARKRRPVILSTAMSRIDEVKASVAVIKENGVSDLLVMQCTGDYPAPAEDANLRAMATIGRECDVLIGYSDHVMNSAVTYAAIGLGAKAYEKHFTLGRWLPGPDHRASIDPDRLTGLIADIRTVEAALGDGVKRVMPSEEKNRARLRKSLLAARDLPAGTVLSAADIVVKRAGSAGMSAGQYPLALGKKLNRSLGLEEPIAQDMLA